MNVALIGATGPVGKHIMQELIDRGHKVKAIVRDVSKVPAHSSVSAASADVDDADGLAAVLAGSDAVISSVRFLKTDPAKLIGAVRKAGVQRYLVVGGAASLYAPGTTTKLLDAGQIPEEYLPEPTAGSTFFDYLKQVDDLDWTFLSPPMGFSNDVQFGTKRGGRTGKYRLGKDELLVNEAGESEISYEDYAVAMVDELEQGAHIKQRFTVAY